MTRPGRRRTLDDLAALEAHLLAQVWAAQGDAGARDRTLQRAGVYRGYARLFRVYARRSGNGAEGAEALRRAAFLLWCAGALPSCLTGVDELGESDQAEVVGWLDDVCADRALDPQLAWMLPHYHGRCPAVFRRWGEHRALRAFLQDASAQAWRRASPDPRAFAGRGLMGHYWQAVARAG